MRLRRSVTALSVLAILGAFVGLPTPAYADTTTETYIVQLKSGVSADKVTGRLMGASARVIHKVFQGGIVKLTAAQAQSLAANPDVKSVHKDAVVKATGTETNAPWDLDILDSPTATLDTNYTAPNNGSGVTVYVVDSGIMRAHPEFSGVTITAGINFVANVDTSTSCGKGKTADPTVNPANTNDEAGHGTEVSSLIAGATLGASKGVTIVPVRVLNCDGEGSESAIISAAEWIASTRTSGAPAVANLSFGVATADLNGDTSLDTAIQGLIDSGVSVVAAAGNGVYDAKTKTNVGVDACLYTPASLPDAITVASVNRMHAQSPFSNWGTCVDLYAPGELVYIASIATPHIPMTGSGTSFSAPLVTAAAAQVLHDHPTWTPAQVAADVTSRSTPDIIGGASTANHLLNVTAKFAGTDPTITGALYAGETAEATLNWTPTPTTVTYQWYRDGAVIPGATTATYDTTLADVDVPITVTATGTSSGYLPVTGTSAPFTPALGLVMAAGTPTVTGQPAVSYTLTADPGTWDPSDVTLTYQWRREGVDIAGATASTYAPVAADVGQTLTVQVKGVKDGYAYEKGESAPTDVIQSATSVLAYTPFVKASIQDFLSRPATDDEVTSYADQLSSGALTTNGYLTTLANSDEWLSAIVTKMYQDTLGRDPDPAGLTTWVSWLRSGRFTVAQVASLFYASDEYYTYHAGNSATSWVTLLYEKMLNREPDPAGLAGWVTYTNNPKYGRSWVAYQFFQSQESRMLRVEHLYQALLYREPDPTGWPFWTQTVLTMGDLTLAITLASSQEYWERAHVRF